MNAHFSIAADLAAADLPEPNIEQAVAFLQALDPSGHHLLTLFDQNMRPVESRVFAPGPSQWTQVRNWLDHRVRRGSICYSQNEPRPDVGTIVKLMKEHIGKIRAVSIDLDPREGEPLRDARTRLLSSAREMMDDVPVCPSFLVDSGGGIQAIWKLSAKLDACEYQERAEEQGRGLAAQFLGDSTQNIDRVMRLPGTINFLSEKKRRAGRTIAPAVLIDASGLTFDLDGLANIAPPVAAPESKAGEDAQVAEIVKALDMGVVRSATEWAELPEALKEKFETACQSVPPLRPLWEGDPSALLKGADGDTSGSAFRAALAAYLKPAGFTAQEFGQLLFVWEHATTKDRDTINRRTIARDWVHMGSLLEHPSADDEFDVIPGEEREPQQPKTRLQRVSFSDAIQKAMIDPPEPLLEGLLDQSSLAVLYGPSNTGKSFLVLDMAFHIAAGRSWNGRDVAQGPVIYLAGEGGRRFGLRMAALQKHYGLTEDDARLLPLELICDSLDLRTSNSDATALRQRIDQAAVDHGAKPALVIIDTLSQALAGGDENSSVDMGTTIRRAGDLQKATGACVLLIHHTGKDESRGMRGWSGAKGNVDVTIQCPPSAPMAQICGCDLRRIWASSQ